MRPEDRIAELEEEVRQLREALAPAHLLAPIEYKLTPAEQRLYSALAVGGVLPDERLEQAIGEGRIISEGLLRTHITKLRKKLRPFNVRIVNISGIGYYLDPPHG